MLCCEHITPDDALFILAIAYIRNINKGKIHVHEDCCRSCKGGGDWSFAGQQWLLGNVLLCACIFNGPWKRTTREDSKLGLCDTFWYCWRCCRLCGKNESYSCIRGRHLTLFRCLYITRPRLPLLLSIGSRFFSKQRILYSKSMLVC